MEKSAAAGPVQIVSITEDHKFVLDEKKLKEILYHRRAQGKKVKLISQKSSSFNYILILIYVYTQIALISIAGDFRKGKSFMLDFFLRYLRAKVNILSNNLECINIVFKLIQNPKEWIGKENEPLKGFDWRGGAGRHTTGMIMWSEPFFTSLPNGEEVCIDQCLYYFKIKILL